MKSRTKRRLTGFILCFVMVFNMLTISPVFAYYEEPTAEGNEELETSVYDYTKPVGVTMERFTGTCMTETDNLGDDFLFVIKSGDRYYAMKDVAARESDYESIPAVDVTDWINSDGSLTVPEDTLDVAFWRYEERDGYEYGVFINGREDYLGYSYSYEPTDGDDDYWNDSDRIYSGSFEVNTFEEGNWIMDPYYYSENDVSGTLKFNGTWDEKISTYRYITHRYEMITDIRSNGNGGKEFYFRYLGSDVPYTGEEVEGYLYYADCRHQFTVRHAEYDAPTCMLKGCEEYWYCEGCNEYMKDENFNEHFGQEMPVIPALGHDWDSEKCNNCDRPVPVYSKVTNKADFDALADDTMYILVAEYEGKYYTPDVGEMYLYMMDSNGDGFNDIYDIDDNNNGISDMFEIDGDNDGKYDYLDWDADGDGVITEVDMIEYYEQLCHAYLSDKLYGSSDDIPVKEIKINDDGTISHEEVKDSVEFEMVDLYTEEDIDWMIDDIKSYEDWWSDDYLYTYECMKQFVIPNMYITAPSLLPMERQYKQRIADAGDTESWGVLFYNDAEYCKYYNYDLEAAVNVPFNDVCLEDSVAVFSAFDYYWHYNEEQLGQIRLRDYEETLSFVTGQAWELDGWEYVDDENGGYYDTHDTQACVYLYASQQISHVCDFGPWVEDNGTDTHTRTCKDESCGKTETNPHEWDEGVEIKAPKCDETGETKYTCIDCGATKLEEITSLGHEWSDWEDDGEKSGTDTHTHICGRDKCGKIEQENHSWENWVPEDENNHIKYCSECSGTRTDTHNWDDGVVINWATHLYPGAVEYTCYDCGYFYIGEMPKVEEHEWSDWVENNDGKTHTRTCVCDASETKPHSWGDWIKQDAGDYIRKCDDCGASEIGEKLSAVIKADNDVTKTNVGERVVYRGYASGGTGDYLYKFALLDVSTNKWTIISDFSDKSEIVYNADKEGKYQFAMTVKDSAGSVVSAKRVELVVEKAKALTGVLSVNGNTENLTVVEATDLIVNISATGGSGIYSYKYAMLNTKTGKWTVLRNFTVDNKYVLSEIEEGTYQFAATVKDDTGKTLSTNRVTVVVEKRNVPLSGSLMVNGEYKLEANLKDELLLTVEASGGSGDYTYKYAMLNTETGKWTILKDFSDAKEYIYITENEGTYQFAATIKDSTGKTLSTNRVTVVIVKREEPLSGTLTVNGSSDKLTVNKGTQIALTASANGGSGNYTYKFAVMNASTKKWSVLKDFDNESTYIYSLDYLGTKEFAVTIKDSTGATVSTKRLIVVVK